jgi:hypothetical protein
MLLPALVLASAVAYVTKTYIAPEALKTLKLSGDPVLGPLVAAALGGLLFAGIAYLFKKQHGLAIGIKEIVLFSAVYLVVGTSSYVSSLLGLAGSDALLGDALSAAAIGFPFAFLLNRCKL